MTDFALAISASEHIEDLELLVDIVRRNWQANVHVVVSLATRRFLPQVQKLNVDDVVVADTNNGDSALDNESQIRLLKTLRTVGTLQKACACAVRVDAPWTIHLQAGDYTLSWAGLCSIGEAMQRHGKVFAARGMGFGYYTHETPVGQFDESFFVFNNEFARDRQLWSFDLIDLLPHKVSVQGFLALWGLGRVGVRRLWHYSQPKEAVYWDGQSVGTPELNSSHPMYFDPKYSFLSIRETAFPGDLGSRLKAYYLKKHGLTQGAALEVFLHKWDRNIDSLFEELEDLETWQREFFRRRRLEYRGRDLARMDRVIKECHELTVVGGACWLVARHCEQVKRRVGRMFHERLIKGWVYRYRNGDMVWPGRLDMFYRPMYRGAPNGTHELQGVPFEMQELR